MKLVDIINEWIHKNGINVDTSGYLSCKRCNSYIGLVKSSYVYIYGHKYGKIMPHEPDFFEQIIERIGHPCQTHGYENDMD